MALIYEPIASLFPLDLSGEIVALRACIDAGTQEGVFCLAAIAFGYHRAVKANREWEQLLKGRTFHMTDLNAREKDFKGIKKDEVDAIMVGTVAIIRKYASFAVALSCDAELIADSLPVVAENQPDMQRMLAALRSTYGCMCHFAMTAIGTRANNNQPGRQISYVLERGDKGQRGVERYLDFLGSEPYHGVILDSYSLNRSTVADKEEIEGIFHASDLLAWEWARHVGRYKNDKPMRRSLAELAGNAHAVSDELGISLMDGRRFFCGHLSPERLQAFLAFYRETLAATTREEVDAAVNRYRELYPARP